ncbi:uncharacterized protein LOC118734653 [Rhagoletis pomonella]|uniref:uncharacterized protein LOC118734653 n=1 Tax=Rhagoletis pomonella TaxID=28610 RepID=UPI00177E6208|nr:uncharacterized protein LOC118734653 [Rhagoletis pomonella]
MSSRLVFYLCLLLATMATLTDFTQSLEIFETLDIPETSKMNIAPENVPKSRTKRGIFWDFFQKMVTTKNLIVDQYFDTRDTLSGVYNLLNEGFSDPAPPKATLRPLTSTAKTSDEDQSGSSEMSTTTEAFSISRYELGRILGRNFRGLQRLTKIEFQDAFNQSHYNVQEYKEEARKQFANSVGVEKVNKLKGLKTALNG